MQFGKVGLSLFPGFSTRGNEKKRELLQLLFILENKTRQFLETGGRRGSIPCIPLIRLPLIASSMKRLG